MIHHPISTPPHQCQKLENFNMPFTETQPINIHDITIETPQNTNNWSNLDLGNYISRQDFEKLGNLQVNLNNVAELKIVGILDTISESGKSSLRRGYDNHCQRGKYDQTFLRLFYCRNVFGDQVELTEEQQTESLQTAGENPLMLAELMSGHILKAQSERNLKYLEQALLEPVRYLSTLAALRIFGVQFELNHDVKNEIKKDIAIWSGSSQIQLIKLSQMAIVTSDKVEFDENGIQLIRNNSNFHTTPPIPEIRNF